MLPHKGGYDCSGMLPGMLTVNLGFLVLFVHCTLRLLTHWSAESHVLIAIEIHTRLRGFQYL